MFLKKSSSSVAWNILSWKHLKLNKFSFILSDFACSSGIRQTGVKNSILISNFSRSLWIKTFTQRKTKDWVEAIEKVINGDPGESIKLFDKYRFREFILYTKVFKITEWSKK